MTVSGSVRLSERQCELVCERKCEAEKRGEGGEGKGDSPRSRSHSAHTFLTLPLTAGPRRIPLPLPSLPSLLGLTLSLTEKCERSVRKV